MSFKFPEVNIKTRLFFFFLEQAEDELAEAVVEGLDVDNGPAALFYTLKALDLNPDFER